MRHAVLPLALLLLVPLTAAEHEGFVLLHARMDTVFDPLTLEQAWDFVFTVRNDGPARPAWAAIHEAPIVFDLMWTQWYDDPWMDAGETRETVVRIDWSPPNVVVVGAPDWLCLQIGDDWPVNRCWSVMPGVPLPDGVYPENVPHPLLLGVPMGDSE